MYKEQLRCDSRKSCSRTKLRWLRPSLRRTRVKDDTMTDRPRITPWRGALLLVFTVLLAEACAFQAGGKPGGRSAGAVAAAAGGGGVAPNVRKAFELFDADGSGDIDAAELEQAS